MQKNILKNCNYFSENLYLPSAVYSLLPEFSRGIIFFRISWVSSIGPDPGIV
jgi:hypothetical protein